MLFKCFAIRPTTVAAYIEQLGIVMAKPSVKQHLAGIRQLFDYLVTGGILPSNPAGASARTQVRGKARQDSGSVAGERRCDAASRGLLRERQARVAAAA